MAIKVQKNTASLNQDLASRSREVAETMGRVAQSWSHQSSSIDGVLEFAKPPISHSLGPDATATLHVLVAGHSFGERELSVRPVFSGSPRTMGSPLAKLTVNSNGWHSVAFRASLGAAFAVENDGEGGMRLETVAIWLDPVDELANGTRVPLEWEKKSIEYYYRPLLSGFAYERPDDLAAHRWAREAAAHVLGRYPRCLGAHSLAPRAGIRTTQTPTQAQWVRHTYPVRRGPRVSDVTVRFRAFAYSFFKLSGHNIPYVNQGQFAVRLDGQLKGSGLVAPGVDWYEVTIPASEWTADDLHHVTVEALADWLGPEPDGDGAWGGRAAISSIVIEEEPYDPAEILRTSSSGRTEVRTYRHIEPVSAHMRLLNPLLAFDRGGSGRGRFTDRHTTMCNAAFHAERRVQTLIADRPYAPMGAWWPVGDDGPNTFSGANGTRAGGADPDLLAAFRYTATQGTSHLRLLLRMIRLTHGEGIDLGGSSLVLERFAWAEVYVNSEPTGISIHTGRWHDELDPTPSLMNGQQPRWYSVDVPVVEGEDHEIWIVCGLRTKESSVWDFFESTVNAVYLFGVEAHEVPRIAPPGPVNFYRRDDRHTEIYSGGTGVTRKFEAPVTESFVGHKVGVRIDVSGGDRTQLVYTLERDDKEIVLKGLGQDDGEQAIYMDPPDARTAPDEPLAQVEGEQIAGEWTIRVYRATGGSPRPTLTSVRLEID